MRAAAQILLVEAEALRPILEATPALHFDRPTVCDGWSVRDVLAHCGAALTHAAAGTVHSFSPDDNERDVAARRTWPLPEILAELFRGYEAAAVAIDAAGGFLDGVGLGEWIHGGDVRDALDAERAYASEGVELAVPLLVERSRARQAPHIDVEIEGRRYRFGAGDRVGTLSTDLETFIRLVSGRRPDPGRYQLAGVSAEVLTLFS